MPIVWKGNTSTEATSPDTDLPFTITFFTITNKASSAAVINVVVVFNEEEIAIVPNNLSLDEGDMLEGDSQQVMEAGSNIKITSDNSVDYYFTIDNTIAP